MGAIMTIRIKTAIACAATAMFCLAAAAGTGLAVPRMGLYFDGHRFYRPPGQFVLFEGQLLLSGADTLVSAVEYGLQTPFDPSHNILIITGVEYPDNSPIQIGNPWSGHSISFWPPLDGTQEYNLLCTITFLMFYTCDQIPLYDAPIVIGPSPDSGYLRGTSYPGHILFDIFGETSYLCPSHWPPELSGLIVCTPRCLRAGFNQYVYNYGWSYNDVFTLYTTAEPRDTIDVLLAAKNPPTDPPGDDFFVYLASPMQEGVGYTLEAHACAECNGCATSTKSFVYEGGYADAPDLAVTFWSNHENYLESPDDCSEVEIGYVVRNLGTLESGPFLMRVTAGPYGSTETETVWSDSCGGLPVDGTLGGPVSVIVPYLPADYGQMRFEADYAGWIEEANEDDDHRDARYGNSRPEISSVTDMPEDYGRQVEMVFLGSWYDISRPAAGDQYRVLRRNLLTGEWEYIHQLEATSDTVYTCIVPTQIDSSGGAGDFMTSFMVEYYRASYAIFTSCPDSGYSVDDLGPIGTLLAESSVETDGDAVLLRWTVSSCAGLDEFIVSRAQPGGDAEVIGTLRVLPGEVAYEFEDASAERGTEYIYRVEWTDGERTRPLFESEPVKLPPLPLALRQNRPNPFNPSTEITFSLAGPSAVTLEIFDVSGKRVRRLLDGYRPGGLHSVVWDGLGDDGTQAASGVYFYLLTADGHRLSRKMVLLR
jgi:hypothetical protein